MLKIYWGWRGDTIQETWKQVRWLLQYSGANVIVTWTWVSSSSVLTMSLLFLHTIQSIALAQGCCFIFYADTALFLSPITVDEYLQTPLPPSLEQDLTSITSFIQLFHSASIIKSLLTILLLSAFKFRHFSLFTEAFPE